MGVLWQWQAQRCDSTSGTVQQAHSHLTCHYDEHRGVVYAVAWSPDGHRLASGSFDGTIHVWDAQLGKRLADHQHSGWVRAITWDPSSLPDRKSVLGKVVSVESARIERKDEGAFMIVLKKKLLEKRKIMNPFEVVLAHWHKQVKELFPQLHSYQQETLAYCVQGIVQAGSAVMQKVAETMTEYLDSETKIVSHERRMQRFTENERIDVYECWKTFLETILPYFKGKRMTLVLDPTPYTETSTIVYLGILVSTRVLPIAWCIMPQKEKWDRGQWEIIGTLFRAP